MRISSRKLFLVIPFATFASLFFTPLDDEIQDIENCLSADISLHRPSS